MQKVKLIPTTSSETYAKDKAGDVWATFRAINHETTCDLCEKTITSGWVKGKLGDNQHYFCSSHIELWVPFATTGWVTCDQCGKQITSGLKTGNLGEETFYCDEHIEAEDEEVS